jgi:endonuclease/exonuclease/phosphatase family metal-dependent hydrolase
MVGLLLAYLGTYVSPLTFWPLAFFSLGYPFILLLNLAFLFWWLVRGKKLKAIITGMAILVGWSTLFNFIQFIPRVGDMEGTKIMSYNVRLFDLYNWSSNERTKDRIIELLQQENADILCLQEFFHSGKSNYLITVPDLLDQTGYAHIHDKYMQRTRNDHHFGIATLTNYPVIDRGNVPLSDEVNNVCIWTDLAFQGDTVRVYNAHLASIHFGESDYQFIQELDADENVKTTAGLGKIGRLINLLKVGFQKRAKQTHEIRAHMAECPHPILYAGDLNDSPTSYAYRQLTEELEDAFISSGSGIGSTYIGAFPSFRIDHILHSDDFSSTGFKTLSDELSDHRAISCWVQLEK